MWMQFDQFAKSLLDKLLRPVGSVRSEYEVRSTVQAVDMWFVPEPERAAERARLGALAPISEETCMLEPFQQAPGLQEVRACIRKQYNLAHWQEQEARAAQKEMASQAAQVASPAQEQTALTNETATTDPAFPRLWILSAGRPETVLSRYEMRRMDGDDGGDEHCWLPGFWQAADGHALHVVVLRDLPVTLDTLFLRLMGAGATHRRAVADIAALPRDSWQYQLAMPLLLAHRIKMPPGLYDDSEDDMQYTETLERLYAEWEQRVKDQTMRDNIIELYQTRFSSMPDDMRAAITRIEGEGKLRRLLKAAAIGTLEEVSTAVREAANPT
jgi:hypothetical protein